MTAGFDAVIFDLDGTLIDSVRADFLACSALFEEHGAVLPAEVWAREVCGRPDGYPRLFEILRYSGATRTAAQLHQRLTELWDVFMTPDHIRLLPGAREAPARLRSRGLRTAVASAADRDWVRRWLRHFALDTSFDVVVAGDEVPRRKPDPAVHLKAAELLGVPPAHCVVVEDSLTGIAAARAAGMRVIAVPTVLTRDLDHSAADRVVPDLNAVDPTALALAPHPPRPRQPHARKDTGACPSPGSP